MKENISINGNETIEELVKKVTTVESIDYKLGVCIMIITHLEIKNGVRPGSYNHTIGMSEKYPIDPKVVPSYFKHDIYTFLFLLKKSDDNCYLELIEKYSKLSKMEGRKEKIITWSVIGGFIILIYILFTF